MATKIENLRLEPANNGFVLCWTDITDNSAPGKIGGNPIYKYNEEVYKDNEESQVLGRFKDLKAQMRKSDAVPAESKEEEY